MQTSILKLIMLRGVLCDQPKLTRGKNRDILFIIIVLRNGYNVIAA